MKHFKSLILCFSLAFLLGTVVYANVKLSPLFSDHMVIQRNQPMKVWGTVDAGEKIQVLFRESNLSTKADKKGNWQVVLPPYDFGGPFEMVISGSNKITFTDILIGDVWVCAGQSNMQFELSTVKNPEKELAEAIHPEIRLFGVSYRMNEEPLNTLENGSWKVCTPEDAANFSAVGYFFGRHLSSELHIPIGLIANAVGGSSIETWSSEASLLKFPRFQQPFEELKTLNFSEINVKTAKFYEAWNDTISQYELGTVEKWYFPETDTKDWQSKTIPYEWNAIQGIGAGWFRKEFDLTEKEASSNIVSIL